MIKSSKDNDSSPPPSARRSARIKEQNQSSNKKSKSTEKSPNQQTRAGQRGRSQAKEHQRGSSAKKTAQTKSPASQRQSSNKKQASGRNATPTKKSRSNSPISTNKSTKNRKSKRKASHISPANKSQSKSPTSVGQTRRKSQIKKTKLTEQQQAGENETEIQINLPKKRLSTAVKAEDQDEEADAEAQQRTKKRVSGLKKKMNTEEVPRANRAHMRVFDLNIQIKGEKFIIFRNVYVNEKIELTKLARILTTSMGWLGIWDWTFKINNSIILCPPDDDSTRGITTPSRRYGDEVKFDSFNLKVGDKFEFIYNTKAPWTHEIVIEDLEIIDLPENGSIQDPEKSKRTQHAVVSIGNMTVPPDAMTKQDFDQVWEDYENGEKEFSKWKRKFGEAFDPAKFEKNRINDLLKIYLYDESQLDPKVKEADLFFKW